jgi:branched-chain amino acid aminotransferase
MSQYPDWLWYDGKFVATEAASIPILTHSLHYGVAVFEGIRAYKTADRGTAIFRLDAHLQRFFASAHAYRMHVPYSMDELTAAHVELLRKIALDEAYIRPIAFFGSEKMGLLPKGLSVHVAVAAWSWGAYLGDAAAVNGIRVKTSSYVRPVANSGLTRAKVSGNYPNSILAKIEATDDGYDEALLLDSQGYVAEGSGENIFIVKRGTLIEPEPSAALLGITRESVIELAQELGLKFESRRLTRDDVYNADEAFFTGTAAEVVPIVELDRRTIGTGKRGPVTERLQQAYSSAIRARDPKHTDWLTFV